MFIDTRLQRWTPRSVVTAKTATRIFRASALTWNLANLILYSKEKLNYWCYKEKRSKALSRKAFLLLSSFIKQISNLITFIYLCLCYCVCVSRHMKNICIYILNTYNNNKHMHTDVFATMRNV